jgi:hypothetical protein
MVDEITKVGTASGAGDKAKATRVSAEFKGVHKKMGQLFLM